MKGGNVKNPRFSDEEVIEILKEGISVLAICEEYGVSKSLVYNWRKRFPIKNQDLVPGYKNHVGNNNEKRRDRFVELIYENAALRSEFSALKQTIADLVVYKAVLLENANRPALKRELAKKAVSNHGVSIKKACRLFEISESCYRYSAKG